MFYIKKAEFDRLRKEHPDYISKAGTAHTWNGKTCNAGDYMGFESTITGDYSKGTTLIFQHIHFEIVDQ